MEDPKPKVKKRYYYPERTAANLRRKIKRLPDEPHGQNFSQPRGMMAIRTMKEVAEIMGIDKSRVHQLERVAFWKIRKGLKEFATYLAERYGKG